MSDFPGPPDDPSDAEAVFTESKTFKECVRAFDRGDDETAVLKLKELAGSGYAKAQHHLAFMYREGWGTEVINQALSGLEAGFRSKVEDMKSQKIPD